jgi:hypothetical protein
MARKPLQEENEINLALDVFIQTRACITDRLIYLSPDAASQELKNEGTEISSVTIADRYKKYGIRYERGLWVKTV